MRTTTISAAQGRIATVGLCLSVALIHVTDQGGFTVMGDPTWLGWGYRAIEVGATVAAVLVLLDLPAPRLTGLALLGIGAGPFIGYVLTRTTGLPQDSADIGTWGDPLGTMSLVVEGTLVVIGLAMVAGGKAVDEATEAPSAVRPRSTVTV